MKIILEALEDTLWAEASKETVKNQIKQCSYQTQFCQICTNDCLYFLQENKKTILMVLVYIDDITVATSHDFRMIC